MDNNCLSAVFMEYSASVDGILPHKLLETYYICFTTLIYVLIAVVVV